MHNTASPAPAPLAVESADLTTFATLVNTHLCSSGFFRVVFIVSHKSIIHKSSVMPPFTLRYLFQCVRRLFCVQLHCNGKMCSDFKAVLLPLLAWTPDPY